MERAEVQMKISQTIARAWAEPAFKARLKQDPRAALSEMGIELHEGVRMTVVEDSAKHWYLYIPQAPEELKEGIDPLLSLGADGSSSSSSGQCCKCALPD